MDCRKTTTAYIIPGSLVREIASDVVEPITLETAKGYLHVGYDDEDDLIKDIITAAREWAEEFTGVGLVPASVRCTVNCPYQQSIELRYGPVTTLPTQVLASNIQTGEFPRIKNIGGRVDVSYQSGYTTIPKGLKMGILAKIANLFENRGDKAPEPDTQAQKLLTKYKRVTAWL